MNILFIHPNFPAQFKHIAAQSAKEGHSVKFICQTHYGRSIKGVKRLKLKGQSSFEELEKQKLNIFNKAQEMSSQFRRAYVSITEQKWVPDLVISHSGWGCGMHVKEVWPECFHISYLEWWFNPSSSFFEYDKYNADLNVNKNMIPKAWKRNQSIALELGAADAVVAPTNWQREQLPLTFQNKCMVIFDGINLNFFKRNSLYSSKLKTVTYGTRGMEAMRCFPQFIKSLPKVIQTIPDVSIEIAGSDSINYCGAPPENFKSWKKWAINFIKTNNIEQSITWLGHLGKEDYRNWLHKSSCHVYLTHPFVASWSLVDAICSDCKIVASDVEPVKDFEPYCFDNQLTLVDHRNVENLSHAIIASLQQRVSLKTGHRGVHPLRHDLSCEDSWRKWHRVYGEQVPTGA